MASWLPGRSRQSGSQAESASSGPRNSEAQRKYRDTVPFDARFEENYDHEYHTAGGNRMRKLGSYDISRRGWMRMAACCALARHAVPSRAASGLLRAAELHHLVLTVSNLDRSGDFYRRLLGPRRFERMGNRLVLGFERDFLELVQGAAAGMDHFSIAIEDFQAGATASTLQAAGWKPERVDAETLIVRDPDGIALGLCRRGHGRQGAGNAAKQDSLFRAVDLNHVALRVAEIGRSRDFYQKLLGLEVASESAGSCFLSLGGDFLALFRGQPAGRLDHFCVSVDGYTADGAAAVLTKEGHQVRRTADRIYFPDPDNLTVQLSAPGHRP